VKTRKHAAHDYGATNEATKAATNVTFEPIQPEGGRRAVVEAHSLIAAKKTNDPVA
jgi:hypothetical protein